MPRLDHHPRKPDDLALWIGAPSRSEKVLAVGRSLNAADLPFAFGGGLALAYYGEPRVTVDIDINVFVTVERWPTMRDALTPLRVETEGDAADLARDKEVKLDWEGTQVHLFFSHDELHAAMAAAVREVPFGGETIPIVSPEHLIVRKVILDRPKDWPDVEAILSATADLDLPEIETWVRRLAGPDDPRFTKLQGLIRHLVT